MCFHRYASRANSTSARRRDWWPSPCLSFQSPFRSAENRRPATSRTRSPSTLTGTHVRAHVQVFAAFGALIRILFHPAFRATGKQQQGQDPPACRPRLAIRHPTDYRRLRAPLRAGHFRRVFLNLAHGFRDLFHGRPVRQQVGLPQPASLTAQPVIGGSDILLLPTREPFGRE